MNAIHLDADLKPLAYAWPGGYPVFYLARSGWRDDNTGQLEFNTYDRSEFILCPECAARARERDFILTASEVHWEGSPLLCEECGAQVESAYGEPGKERGEP